MARIGGRRARKLSKLIRARYGEICWLCGKPGADTADHVIPVELRPDLEFDVDNLRPAHGERRTIAEDGFECMGNFARGAAAPPTDALTSRRWR